MIADELDIGARCDRHVGEVFRPRCNDCERERTAASQTRGAPGTECAKHPGYIHDHPTGYCARCVRDLEGTNA